MSPFSPRRAADLAPTPLPPVPDGHYTITKLYVAVEQFKRSDRRGIEIADPETGEVLARYVLAASKGRQRCPRVVISITRKEPPDAA